MIRNKKWNILILALSLILNSYQTKKTSIPYPKAIQNSAIIQNDISSIIDNGIIIGNGDITALVFSEEGKLAIHLSKNDIGDWRNDTREDNAIVPFKKIRDEGVKGVFDGSGRDKNIGWNKFPYSTPIPCGKVVLEMEFDGPYSSILDINEAVASFKSDRAINNEVKVCALKQKNVFLIKGAAKADLFSHKVKHLESAQKSIDCDVHVLYQKLPSYIDWPGMEYAVAMKQEDDLIAISIVSGFDHKSPKKKAVSLVRDALKDPQNELDIHKNQWKEFWAKSGIKLADKYLESVWYRNLYFFRCVSKANTAPPGLYAGMIQDDRPMWHAAHTLNYNAQQRNWGAYASNHVDLSDSFRWLIERYMGNARWLCKTLFDFDAVYFPHNLFTYQSNHVSSKQKGNGVHMYMPWGYSVGITGWVFQNIWWQYEYAPDNEFLKNTAYPMLKEAAMFYTQFIESCELQGSGKVLFGPSVSPEHLGFANDLSINWNETHGLVYAKFALETAIEAANILNTDKADVEMFQIALDKLPEYPTYGDDGKEVLVWSENAEPIEYNLPIPCFPVFPGERITWFSDEEEKELLERSISQTKSNGNNDAVITSIARSRLSMDDAYDYAVKICKDRQRENGTLSLNVLGSTFNKFGHYTEQFATTAVVSELLLQSVGHIIRVFPAWDTSKDAEFKNLRAKGGFLVSSSLKNGECEYIQIESTVGGTLKIVSPWTYIEVQSNGVKKKIRANSQGIIQIETSGNQYIILRNQE